MEQLAFFTIPSPCIGVCAVDEKGYCKGCMRTRKERFHWLDFTPAQQLYVIKLCQQRYHRKQRRGEMKPEEKLQSANSQPDLFSEE